MNTEKVTRVEVIDHTNPKSKNYGRVYTFWHEYDKADIKDPKVELHIQDGGRTLKIFISKK